MPKGEGSPRLLCLSADLLEERLLMSRGVVVATVHALSVTTSQVAPIVVVSHPDSDSTHSTSANTGDVQDRDAEEVAAAAQGSSSSGKDQTTFPLILNTRSSTESDEASGNADGVLATSRNLRVSYGDEHVAWGMVGSNVPNFVPMAHEGSELSPEVPELSLEPLVEVEVEDRVVSVSFSKVELGEQLILVATQGADLLAPFLPVDRAGLESAIDRLFDGIEVLSAEMAKEGEAAELIPLPIVWGIGLVVVEVIRRRLRPRDEGDDGSDRDPALGLRGDAG